MNIASIPDYSDADLLKAFRYGLVQLAISEEVTIAGRTVKRSQIPYIKDAIIWLESRIAAVGNSDGGLIALAQLNDALGLNQPDQTGTGTS